MNKKLLLLKSLEVQFGKCNFNATYYDENTTPIKKEKWSYEDVYFKPLMKSIEALDIILKKNVDVLRIKITSSVEKYNEKRIKGCRKLTKKEYKLLKEELKDEKLPGII